MYLDIQGYELEALKGMDKQFEFLDYIYYDVGISFEYFKGFRFPQ